MNILKNAKQKRCFLAYKGRKILELSPEIEYDVDKGISFNFGIQAKMTTVGFLECEERGNDIIFNSNDPIFATITSNDDKPISDNVGNKWMKEAEEQKTQKK